MPYRIWAIPDIEVGKRGKTAKVFIIDDQSWASDLCMEWLAGEGHQVFAPDDIDICISVLLGKKQISRKDEALLSQNVLQ